jgi:formylglycine-generating enzyme required for sulfatase activity
MCSSKGWSYSAAGCASSGSDASSDASPDAGGPASCQTSGPGLTNCGASSESCCTSIEIPSGTYDRTYTNPDGGAATGEADPATISGFRMDKYLVTVGRFRQFVNAWTGGYVPPAGSGKQTQLNGGNGLNATGGGYEPGWVASDDSNLAPTNTNLSSCSPSSTWTNSAGSQENLPINCVNWWESYAFCIWDGGFLPSEAEWEYVAAGGSQQLEYPWGSVTPGTACPGTGCQYAIYNCDYPSGSGTCTGVANIAPVGTATLGAGYWGQLDMAGELWEWNVDWYGTYSACTDCADFTSATTRVIRGGYFSDFVAYLLATARFGDTPASRNFDAGFRCARTP